MCQIGSLSGNIFDRFSKNYSLKLDFIDKILTIWLIFCIFDQLRK